MKREVLRKLVAEIIEADPAVLLPDTDLRTLPNFDSVNILSLMIALDEQAKIKLGPEQAAKLQFYREIEQLAAEQGIELTD